MKKIKCCHNCESRHLGCHAVCEEYIKEKAQLDAEREQMFKGMKEFNDIGSIEVARSIRARKWKGKK